jgi:hypothetical protein
VTCPAGRSGGCLGGEGFGGAGEGAGGGGPAVVGDGGCHQRVLLDLSAGLLEGFAQASVLGLPGERPAADGGVRTSEHEGARGRLVRPDLLLGAYELRWEPGR